jgi:hypothetical protein
VLVKLNVQESSLQEVVDLLPAMILFGIGLSITARDNPMEKVDVIGRVVDMIVGEDADNQIDDFAEKYIGERPYPWRRGETRVKVLIEPVRVHEM